MKFGLEIVKEILEKGWEISMLFSYLPDKKKKYSDYVEFDAVAELYRIPHKKVDNINDKENIEILKTIKPDLILVMGWSQLLKREIINIPKIGIIGSHPTELPKYRGRAPIPWTIIKGLERSAETFFWIEEGTDSGDILDQEIFLIEKNDNASSLYTKVTNLAKKMIIKNLKLIERGIIIRKKQDMTKFVEYWEKRTHDDGKIDWSCSSYDIHKLIRATTHPYPGAFTFFRNGKLTIWEASLTTKPSSKAGEIIGIDDLGVHVGTGDNIIILQSVNFNDEIEINAQKFFSTSDIGSILR